MVSPLGAAELLADSLGLNPQAERTKGAKSTLKLSALQGVLLFQSDGACPELVLSVAERIAELSVEVLNRGLMVLCRHAARARAISFRLKQEKWVGERKTNYHIGNVVGLIHTLVAIGNGNCRKRDADLPSKCCCGDAAKSHCTMNANVTGRRGEALLSKFVICVSNNNPESLIVGRVYRTLPDEDAAKHNLIRVIDETYGEPGSEDGYLYPTSMFVPIELPKVAEQMLMSAGACAQQPLPNMRSAVASTRKAWL